MSLTFGRITDQTDQMIRCLRGYDIFIDEVGIEDTSKLTKTVTASVRKSIFKTVTAMGKPGASVSFAPISTVDGLLRRDFSRMCSDASLKDYVITPSHPSATTGRGRRTARSKSTATLGSTMFLTYKSH
jgi:hypothetical protein